MVAQKTTDYDLALLLKAAEIRLLMLDVDGVLTDGRLYVGDGGTEYKAFYSRDGLGIRMLMTAGIAVSVLSGRKGKCVEQRCADLGIEHVFLGAHDKRAIFEEFLPKTGLQAAQIAFVGDDLIDLPVMTRVGLAVAVHDADPFVVQHAHWQTPHRGGRGAVRDVCELILQAQGQLATIRAQSIA